MRPADLKPPFSWDRRLVLLHDRVWYIPERCASAEPFIFNGWSASEFFGNDNPVHIEYCSGNGAWIADKAVAHPDINWVAVEKKFVRSRKIWSKIKNLELNNLIVICGEAANATRRYIAEETIGDIFINFPDPWPKTRHAKHRLMQTSFVEDVRRILKVGGALTLVTDDPEYSREAIAVMVNHPGFKSQFPDPYYTTEWEGYGGSYFEQLWREKGRIIRYHRFVKE